MKKIIILLLSLLMIAGCNKNKTSFNLTEKTFYNTVDQYNNAEHSNIWLGKDGSFVLIENSHEGYYQMLGKWEINENVLTLNVENSNVLNNSKIIFEIKDDNTMTLKTSLVSSNNNDTFTTDKTLLVNNTDTTVTNNTGNNTNTNTNTNSGSISVPSGTNTDKPATTTNKPATSKLLKKYINTTDYGYKERSFIEFYDDGTFKFTEIEGMGADLIEGLWSYMGEAYALSNFKGDVNDYHGNKLSNLVFEIKDDKTIQLIYDSKVSRVLDYFTTDGKLDEKYLGHGGPEYPIELYDEKWIHNDIPDVSPQYYPTLELFKDGTFVYTENVYAGMAQYKGHYERDSVGIYCTVESHNLQGFAGQDVNSFSFNYIGPDKIQIMQDLCMTRYGDEFHK